MKIVFNYEIFALQRYGGISRYYVELARAMKNRAQQVKIVAPYFINRYLAEENEELVVSLKPMRLIRNRYIDLSPKLNYWYTEYFLKKMKVEICHQTYYTNDLTRNKAVKKVITIHDMIYELFPEDLPELDHIIACKKKYIEAADLIIAVSENTKNDLIRMYPVAKDKTTVVHHGVDPALYRNAKAYKTEKPYLLYVGNRAGYKNFGMLTDLYTEREALHKNYALICFGGGKFTEEEAAKAAQTGILQLEGDDGLLAALYKGAALFVYPSAYEGFGMPVLEAMAAGCPVVCMNSSSLPEVAGNAAFYCNENTKEAMTKVVMHALENEQERKAMIEKGLERVRTFTWDACAEKTLAAYQTLLN